jgi:hypothetical protein
LQAIENRVGIKVLFIYHPKAYSLQQATVIFLDWVKVGVEWTGVDR